MIARRRSPGSTQRPCDKVEATDTKTGKKSAQTVTTVWVNHDTDLMDVTIEAGGKTSTIQATQHHLFWIPAKNAWVEANRLAAGDQLRTDSGAVATVSDTVVATVASTAVVAGAADMWDLTATDPETGQTKAEPVEQLIRHSGKHAMVLVGLADGSVLDSTDGHPIWNASTGRFTTAADLRVGDKIETSTGQLITITALTGYPADLTAYNLQIEQIHTYYAGATPVLVHNSCGAEFRTDTSHIFRNATGHLSDDTAANRALIRGAVDPANLRSTITLNDGSTLDKYFNSPRRGPGVG